LTLLTVIRVELTRLWRNKLGRLGLFVMMVIPLLYSSLYLWAFWDPYGSLDKLPVALVNEDSGGRQDGKPVNFGKDLQKTLLSDKALDWHVVTKAEAEDGVHHDRYYMMLDIPPSFTSDLLSIGTDHPRKANLLFVPNQGRNYLAGQITKRVQDEIAAKLAENLSQKYIQRLLDVLGKATNGMTQIAETANTLAKGSDKVASGAHNLSDSMQSATSGSHKLDNALQQLVPGNGQVVSGLGQVQRGTSQVQGGLQQSLEAVKEIRQKLGPLAEPTGQLATGSAQLADAAQQLADASRQLQQAIDQAASGSKQIADGLSAEQASISQLQTGVSQALALLQSYQQDAGAAADSRVVQAIAVLQSVNSGLHDLQAALQQSAQGAAELSSAMSGIQKGHSQLQDGLQALAQNAGALKAGTQEFQSNIAPLNNALGQIQGGLDQLSTGVKQVQSAQAQLQNGAEQVQNGLVQSQAGSHQLATGMDQLQSGANQLAQGASKLADGQNTFASKVSDSVTTGKLGTPALTAERMSHPIDAIQRALYPVDKYGPGLAPYFVPLSLWVGALMVFFLVPIREGRWKLTPVPHQTVMLGKFALLWGIGVAQAVIASSVLLYGLGLAVTSVPLFYLFNILLSVTYITVIGMFISILGTGRGRVVGIVLLLLQLTSSGGTFPTELIPSFFQTLHPLLPMSYGVSGLRNIIAIHDLPALWRSVWTTALYGAVALVLIMVVKSDKVRGRELRSPDQLVA
jgi:putative membrane protein